MSYDSSGECLVFITIFNMKRKGQRRSEEGEWDEMSKAKEKKQSEKNEVKCVRNELRRIRKEEHEKKVSKKANE